MKKLYLLFVFISLGICSHAQVNMDSLYVVWKDASKADTTRLSAIRNFVYEKVYNSEDKDSALYYCEIMLNFAINKESDYYQAKAYAYMGQVYENKKNLLKAEESKKKELEIFRKIGSRKDIADALWELGSLHSGLNKYVPAIQEYSESLVYYQEINDTVAISGLLNNIGTIYKTQGNYSKALGFFGDALAIIEKTGATNHQAKRNSVDMYIKIGDYTKALFHLNELLNQAENGNFGAYPDKITGKIGINVRFGDVYTAQGNYPLAMDHYRSALEEVKTYPSSGPYIETQIGLLYLKMEKGDLAVESCTRAFEYESNIQEHRNSCECLYKSYKLLGNNERALKYLELFQSYQDSLQIEEISSGLKEMEFTNKMIADSLRQEEEKLRVKLTHQTELSKKKQTQNVFLVSGIIALFIAIGLWSRMHFTRKANARLKKEKDRAESSEQFKHQFLANMSHEIRTPMNAIKGMSDILIRRKPKVDQMKYLNGIKESSDSLLVIINDILDLSKVEMGKIELERISFSIPELINNIDTIMRFKAEEKGLQLKSNIPDSIPQVIGDPTRLRQIIINLLGNAIKFTEKGIVTTSLQLVHQDTDKFEVHFIISDTGIGIDADKLKQVFNSFEQAYSDTSRKFGGTGLGLSISKKLVEIQHGKIWVESDKGKGSQFHFIIPYLLCNTQECTEDKSTQANVATISDQLTGIRILLVEDNAFNVMVAQEELEDAIKDVEVVVAENGAIAVELISHSDFDIVLMDVQMPVMNGYEATAAIRKLENAKSKIPIIAMTANVMKEEVERSHKAGMDDFIGKPFDTEELIQKIYNLIHELT